MRRARRSRRRGRWRCTGALGRCGGRDRLPAARRRPAPARLGRRARRRRGLLDDDLRCFGGSGATISSTGAAASAISSAVGCGAARRRRVPGLAAGFRLGLRRGCGLRLPLGRRALAFGLAGASSPAGAAVTASNAALGAAAARRRGGRRRGLRGARALFALPAGAGARHLLVGELRQVTADDDIERTKHRDDFVARNAELCRQIMNPKLGQTILPDTLTNQLPARNRRFRESPLPAARRRCRSPPSRPFPPPRRARPR